MVDQFHSLPPELVIESVKDISPQESYFSQLVVKNTGGVPAVDLVPSIEIDEVWDQRKFGIIGLTLGKTIPIISRLAPGETSNIEIRDLVPNASRPGSDYVHFSAMLNIKYKAKLRFLSTDYEKKWRIKLIRTQNGFDWLIQVI